MNKKLMALAIAGVMAVPLTAAADGTHVTIFGRLQAEYATIDVDGFNAQTAVADDALQSRWGLQIAEDLGMGLRALGRIEYALNPGGDLHNTAREQWVGLGGDQWGELKFGRVQSVLRDFAGGLTVDAFAETSLHANGSGGLMVSSANGYGSGEHGFVKSAVRFDSPVVEGFSVAGLLMPGDADKIDPTGASNFMGLPGSATAIGSENAGGENGEWDFQAAAKYSGQFDIVGVDVFGAYSRDNVSKFQKSYGVKDEQIWRGGAIFSVADFRLRGQYEHVIDANPFGGAATCTQAAAFGDINALGNNGRGQCNSAMNPNGNGSLWIVGADYTIGNTMLVAQGGMAVAKKTGEATEPFGTYAKRNVENITVGVIHNLSRRSSLFGGYQRVWVKDRNLAPGVDADRNVYTVGVRHDF
ncbi:MULTISPECIES: porin [Nitrosomonas]|uniref:Porin n=2 Tax=Nitrosomonas eutropha TaxID=916 RepID=A0ABX5M7P5_9PROT|nr:MULTISPECIES: porin [Nitrosomonas]ABI60726.1 porin, Gram-negative type [Nitrosomonas eutropha C91]MXS80145.1 porin [Nitrosomonas sp. GH22]PXV79421.1 putative porin [Nitrosomonas eutropha]SCX23364.1 Outer membrane protein (porin) [Nitrosomonas eutropha]SEI48647.1 Outer membrane protein (porin) [Nitrosomonas eutropha]